MVRNWGDVREVLEDIERERLEEKLKKLDDNLSIASQLPSTDPEAVAAHEAENRYYEHLLLVIEAGLVQGVKVHTKPTPPPWYYDIEYPRLTMEGHDLLAALRSKELLNNNPEFPSRSRFYTESEPLPTSLILVSRS